jgi:hypothetical protein
LPVFHASPTQLLLGGGHDYSLTVYSGPEISPKESGRDIPPRHRTETELKRLAETLRAVSGPELSQADVDRETFAMKEQQLAHFMYPGGWSDGTSRVWIVGEASDSTFIDFFADGAFLGRTMLPCPDNRRRIGHSDNWLVLICGVDAGSDTSSTVELQLYSVRDTVAGRIDSAGSPRP